MTKNRSTLKDYFKKGAIPTEANFADLIDSMLNQEDDNIEKLPNDPLKITATGVDEALLNFYRTEKNEEKLSWQVKQNLGQKPGLNIVDAANASRFFIENGSGNIGLGTNTPKAKLQVVGGAIMPDAGSTEAAGLLFPPDAGGGGGDRAWMRYYARRGEGMTLELGTSNDGDDHITLMPSGNVGIGINTPVAKLEVLGAVDFHDGGGYAVQNGFMSSGSLTIGSINKDYGGGSSWNANTAGLLLEAKDRTEIAVHDSGTRVSSLMFYEGAAVNRITIGRDMGAGWGAISNLILNGNIGVGTSTLHNPQGWNKIVDILGTGNARLNVRSSGGVVTSIFSHDDWGGPRGVIGTDSKHPLTFATNYIHRMTIDVDGNVVIGAASADGYKLNVTGNALFTGNYFYVHAESAGRLRVGAAWGIPGLYSGDDGAKDLTLGVPAGRKVYLGTSTTDAYIEGGSGNAYIKGSLSVGGITVGSLTFKGFTGADAEEWPNFTWYRDTNANWDEGLIKGSSARGKFGRAGYGIHMHQSRQFGLFSTGWDSLFAVEGGTGNTFVKGYLAAKQVYFSAYVESNGRTGNLAPLPMQVTSQNVGGAYNTTTSKFTAPVKGLYLFTLSALRADATEDWLHWYLRVNDGYANPGGTSGDEGSERGLMSMKNQTASSSRTVMLALNVNDTVWIQQVGSVTARVDNFRSGLEGVLLYATM